MVQAIAGMVSGVLHVANQLNEACMVIYDFKKHIEKLTSQAREGQDTLTEQNKNFREAQWTLRDAQYAITRLVKLRNFSAVD